MKTKITYRKLPTGNYTGRCSKYYLFIFRRPHGKWCTTISHAGKLLKSEGYFTTYLPTITKAKEWIKINLDILITIQTTSKKYNSWNKRTRLMRS